MGEKSESPPGLTASRIRAKLRLTVHVGQDLNFRDHPTVTACPSSVREILVGDTDWGPAPGQSVFVFNFQCRSAFGD